MLIPTCFQHGTKVRDYGIEVSLDHLNSSEQVLFFNIDCEQFRNSIHYTGKICDYLVYFYHDGKQPTICLLELKSGNFQKAIEQITETYRLIHDRYNNKSCKPSTWKAYICTNGSAPKDTKRIISKLNKEHRPIIWYIAGNSEFSNFMRRK